jgi:hypothetical protein
MMTSFNKFTQNSVLVNNAAQKGLQVSKELMRDRQAKNNFKNYTLKKKMKSCKFCCSSILD